MSENLIYKSETERETIEKYNRDIEAMDGYIYTGNKAKKSMDIFNNRASLAIENLIDLKGKTVLDIGCGDGTFSAEIYKRMGAAKVVGLEPSNAWKLAEKKHAEYKENVSFVNGSAYKMDFPDNHFDVAMMRGVLHHLDDPIAGLEEMMRVSKNVFLLEPNGYNLIIKILEKVSPYHRAHNEKSFAPAKIKKWLLSLGLELQGESFSSLCPLLCPDWFSVFLNWLSPKWEKIPFIPKLTCGIYCIWVKKK